MNNPSRRISCITCLRPQRACICRWIAPVANETDVLILQHPTEVHQAKGSARLLHLSLGRCRIETGETYAEGRLRDLLHGPLDAPAQAVLLYPPASTVAPAPALDAGWLAQPHRLRLVVLDATWRKSLRMLHCNPLLHTLPRLVLNEVRPSAYVIRKARHPHQLSTLEATCHALSHIEQNRQRYRPLLAGFDGFVAQQLAFREEH
jgi:DTW domain-containing protein